MSSDENVKLKHGEQSDDSLSECHGKSPSSKAARKTFSFRKGISRARISAVNENSPKYRLYRIFKSFRKKNKSDVSQNIKSRVDGSFHKPGLKSDKHNEQIYEGKIHKKRHKTKQNRDKLTASNSALKRAFSLRIKSRTDGYSEQIDISSLVKIVNFQQTRKRLATKQATDTVGASRENLNPELERMGALKQTGVEFSVPSPTCGDLYGSDEEGLAAFSFEEKYLLGHRFNETHVLDRKISLDTTESDSVKCLEDLSKQKNSGKFNAAEDIIHENKNELGDDHELHRNCETYSNLTFHLDVSDKTLHKGSSVVETNESLTSVLAGDNEIRTNKSASGGINDLPSFTKGLVSNNCDIVENFGNPWVLKSDCAAVEERTKSSGKDTGSPVSYESLGFSVNVPDRDKSLLSANSAKSTHGRVLKRSTSIESIDSFSSSIHSVKSEECFFSSDSEDDQADNISVSSSDSFTSAKDFADQTDLGSDVAGKIKRASSLDHLDKASPPIHVGVKLTGKFNALDTTPIAKSTVTHTYSVDDVHRIIQRPSSLSFSKGYSLDSASKTDKTPKSEKKKVNKRRSLDSSFKTPEMKSDFKAELEQQTLKPASSDSGLSSGVLSPVQENGDVKLRSQSNIDSYSDKMYYTLPNPRKTKSYPPRLPPRKNPLGLEVYRKCCQKKLSHSRG